MQAFIAHPLSGRQLTVITRTGRSQAGLRLPRLLTAADRARAAAVVAVADGDPMHRILVLRRTRDGLASSAPAPALVATRALVQAEAPERQPWLGSVLAMAALVVGALWYTGLVHLPRHTESVPTLAIQAPTPDAVTGASAIVR